ncbi:MAG: DUF3606 domain-containing protein [Betaproteobacteria bacterium]|nr:MAG: DUF3606 domain-containing protein [Betaproteobacteria bacterium]
MPDNPKLRGGSDRQRINIEQDYEVQEWSQSLGVSSEQLKEAVQAVGDRADKVRDYLKKREGQSSGANERGGSGGEHKSSR